MLVNKAAQREWVPTDYPGIERSLFRNNDSGGRSSVVRLARGARFPTHAHHGTEEVVVLSGRVSIGPAAITRSGKLAVSALSGAARSTTVAMPVVASRSAIGQ